MVAEFQGNIYPHKSSSNSTIIKKYYTPKQHDILFDGFYCTENPKYAMYHFRVGNHYFISIFKLIKLGIPHIIGHD